MENQRAIFAISHHKKTEAPSAGRFCFVGCGTMSELIICNLTYNSEIASSIVPHTRVNVFLAMTKITRS